MYRKAALLGATVLAGAHAQQVGTNTAEVHPKLTVQKCTTSGGCTNSQQSIVLDANWRWLHSTSGYTNCYTGNKFDSTLCPDDATCASNCALDGADYSGTYGISTSGNAVTLKFVTSGANKNIGSRIYLMDSADSKYQQFSLLNQEFTFDVDVSNLPCGLNGALYFSNMATDGGLSQYSTNKAGAKYGTGYCDAQCPQDLKFINGAANVEGWGASATDANAGTGKYGACCSEMDIWEANSAATAYTPHPCSVGVGPYKCTGDDCGNGSDNRYSSVCDKDGCDFNSWRMGNQTFYGPGLTIDTKQKVTVVTQFITSTGTSSGSLSEIKRFYVQNGKVFANSNSHVSGITDANSITDNFCKQQKTAFNDNNQFAAKGGLAKMGTAMQNMVLVMSLWDDHAANCLWLDSTYPTTLDPSTPGANRGPCSTTSGDPKDMEANYPNSSVTYSNIKWGDIGSTFASAGTGGSTGGGSTGGSSTTTKPASSTTKPASTSTKASTTTAAAPTSSAPATGGAAHYAQCGGTGWTGPTTCASPYKCTKSNDYYSQCL